MGWVWIKEHINRKIMGKNQTKPSTSFISRRTGIDRRWITTIAYHPERRSGEDRRSNQYHLFLAPIDSSDQNENDQGNSFPESHSADVSTNAEKSEGIISEQPFPRIPETASVDSEADD